jgi:hypothetical protein
MRAGWVGAARVRLEPVLTSSGLRTGLDTAAHGQRDDNLICNQGDEIYNCIIMELSIILCPL